jgi:hypothetical protein
VSLLNEDLRVFCSGSIIRNEEGEPLQILTAAHCTDQDFIFITTKYDADNYWKLIQKTDNWYGLNPCICRQVDGFSDHCGRHIKASLVCGVGTLEQKKEVYG